MSQDIAPVLQVLVLSDSRETIELLASILADDPGIKLHSARMAFGEGPKAITRFEPHVVVLADSVDGAESAVEELDAAAPDIPCIALLPEGDIAGAQACILAGARATLLRPFDRDGLLSAIYQVHNKESRRRKHMAAALEGGTVRVQRPRIIAVHGAKGGIGATTLACNLGAALHQLTGRSVVLVDGDLLSGDAGVMCDVTTTRTFADLLPALRDLDADFLNELLARQAAGMRVLVAPEHLARAEAIRGEDMQRALGGIKPYFDYTVVDTPSRITPVTIAALDEADLVVLVVTPELIALRDASRFLDLTSQLGYPREKVMLVVNRANTGQQISAQVIQRQLQRPITASIPSDGRAMVECQNMGELIVLSRERHRVASSITLLARQIAVSYGWEPQTKKGRGVAQTPRTELARAEASSGPEDAAAAPAGSRSPSADGHIADPRARRLFGIRLPLIAGKPKLAPAPQTNVTVQ